MEIIEAQRIRSLPPYLFAAIDKKKREVASRGVVSLTVPEARLEQALARIGRVRF